MYRSTARKLLLKRLEEPLTRLLVKSRLSPNALTLIGLLAAGGSAYLISTGSFVIGGIVLLISGVFDLLDGMLARGTNRVTAFGGVLDSVSDRIGEAGILLGLMFFYLTPPMKQELVLIYVTMAGSFMVSYLRARAEIIGVKGDVGIMTRPERVFLLALGLLINQVPIILGIIASLTFFTSGQRLFHIWKASRAK